MVRQQHVNRWLAWALMMVALLTGQHRAHAETTMPRQWTAWAAYWATEGVEEEALRLGGSLQGISLFAAYYDKHEALFVPQELLWLQEDLDQEQDLNVPMLLTIVNDTLKEDGKAILKDRDLLWRKLSTEQERTRHAREIIALAQELGVQGIELDYENLGRDATLWQHYIAFINLMQAEATSANLSLSVVLEPYAVSIASFPEGPSYVVMLYNLYGKHSGPGPKADLAFIKRLVAQMKQNLPGQPAAALSADGFIWRGNGQVDSVTEREAVALAHDVGAQAERDASSGALHFAGKMDGVNLQVWYADGITLSGWAKAAEQEGIQRFYLWLLGGKEEASLDGIR